MKGYRMHRGPEGFREMIVNTMRGLNRLTRDGVEFDTVYVRGNSGLIPGSVIAWRLKKSLMILRKELELSHGNSYEGDAWFLGKKAVIIDDFVASGATLVTMVQAATHFSGKIVGVVMYGHSHTREERVNGFIQTTKMEAEGMKLIRKGSSSLYTLEVTKKEKAT